MDGVIKTPPLRHTSMYIQEGKGSRVQKEKTNNLEEELMKVKKKNVKLLCENDVCKEN